MQDYKKEFVKTLQDIDYSRRFGELMRDFVTIAKVTLANPVYQSVKLEEQYEAVIKRYKDTKGFAKAFAILVEALETNPEQDFLGTVYSEQELTNSRTGQFFTPYHLARVTAELTFNKEQTDKAIAEKGFITVMEPASGCGAMLIAWRNIMANGGYGSGNCWVHATDIDHFCYASTYVQLTLLGVCGLVVHGNTLSGEVYESIYTPVTALCPTFLGQRSYSL